MKTIIYHKTTYFLILVATSLFAVVFMAKVFFNNQSYYKIKCEGLILEKNLKYDFTNKYLNKKQITECNKIILEYPVNDGLMPSSLGILYFDKTHTDWIFKVTDSIQDRSKNINQNILPFLRAKNKKRFKYVYFNPGESIPSNIIEEGLLFNCYGGEQTERVEFTLVKQDSMDLLKYNTDGVLNEYLLKKGSQNVSFLFNSNNAKSDYNFQFTKKSTHFKKDFLISVDSDFFGFKCTIKSNGRVLSSDSKPSFILGNALFSIKPSFPLWQLISFFLIFLQSVGFSIFLIKRIRYCINPLQKSLLLIRFSINQLILLGLPLFINTLNYQGSFNRKIILIILFFLFNLSYFHKAYFTFLKTKLNDKFSFTRLVKNKTLHNAFTSHILKFELRYGFIFFILVLFLFKFGSSNERIFGAPAIHIQKLLLVIAYLIFSSHSWFKIRKSVENFTSKIQNKNWYKYIPFPIPTPTNFLVILFSFFCSITSNDFGALLYVLIAVLFIEVLKGNISIRNTIFAVIQTFFIIILSVLIGLDSAKLYRFLYTFFSPDNFLFEHFNQADRETISYLFKGLRVIFYDSPFGLQQDLIIPNSSQTVSFSDYAFYYSFLLNGFPFLLLFIIVLFSLIFHFTLLLYISLFKVKINSSSSLDSSARKLGLVFSFWFSITIISFIYPVFSNLALHFSIFTGQSLPFISVGIYDIVVVSALLIVLDYSFTTNKFITSDTSNSLSIANARRKTTKVVSIIFIVLLFGIVVKAIQIYYQKDTIEIQKNVSKEDSDYIDLKNRPMLDSMANTYEQEFLLRGKDRAQLKKIRYAFYKGKKPPAIVLSNFKLSNAKFLKKVSLDSFLTFNKVRINGTNAPFGEVFSKKQFVNGKITYTTSDLNYCNSIIYDSLNNDLNAETTFLLKKHIKLMKRNIQGTVIIRENSSGNNIVVATYSENDNIERKLPIENTPYFVGSVKKPLLLLSALSIDENYKNFKVSDSTITQWIAHSSNNYTKMLLNDILSKHYLEFEEVLNEKFSFSFYSNSQISYSDYPKEYFYKNGNPRLDFIRSVGIGGNVKYSPMQVVDWYQKISNLSFQNNESFIREIMNSPLKFGTAYKSVTPNLKANKINPLNFIAKTGTFQKGGNKYINLSSSFVIANKNYTILVVLNGEQQSNGEQKSAKYFFNKIIPLLLKYNVLKKDIN